MSYIGVFILITICILCFIGGIKKLKDFKIEKDDEIKKQKIISGAGLVFFGAAGLNLLLYVIIFI